MIGYSRRGYIEIWSIEIITKSSLSHYEIIPVGTTLKIEEMEKIE